ncbi:hypothetical protein [Kitasatospora sp. NPDC056184]|uniref:hypothetical protein n=1 Tax=Kitasatospora sp. NPDC056184 TaxID=3345738 RepID=UPI0035E3069F
MPTWTSVSRLSVVLDSGGERGTVYANGRNRIGVTISVEPTDEDGHALDVDPQHLLSRLWLIDYADESALGWNGSTGWSYTDAPNRFTAAPAGAPSDDGGGRKITFYVYCGPAAVDPKSIGVRVRTDSGDTFTSSLNGAYHDRVTLEPRAAVTYRKGDVAWEYARTATQEGDNTKYVTTDAWNYRLSLKSADNHFVTFSVSGHFSDSGYDGFFAADIPPEDRHRNFYGGYVWYQEPHGSAYFSSSDGHSLGQIVNFPEGNEWWDYATIYEQNDPDRYLCLTWVHATTVGDGWHIPNGPLGSFKESFNPQIAAYDRYGNTGTFWVDGSDLTGGLTLDDHRP